MTDIEYIDKASYEALKENIMDDPNSKWNPYFIDESTVLVVPFLEKEARDVKRVQIFQKTENGKRKPVLNEENLPHVDVKYTTDNKKIPVTDEQMIEVLNKYLNINFTQEIEKPINDLKDWLLEKKGERIEESQESKQNSEIVQVGETYEYQGKNGKTQVGEISNTQGEDGEDVNGVELGSKKTTEPTGGKRKSKKSKKSKKTKKSKKSKTRKNSRKTNRRR